MKKILAVTFLFILIGAATASADIKAKKLFSYCKSESESGRPLSYCVGYVTGFMSSIDITTNRKNRRIEPNYNLYFDLMKPCMPIRTNVSNIIDLIIKYFGDNTEKMQRPASLVLMEALHNRYPCDNGI